MAMGKVMSATDGGRCEKIPHWKDELFFAEKRYTIPTKSCIIHTFSDTIRFVVKCLMMCGVFGVVSRYFSIVNRAMR